MHKAEQDRRLIQFLMGLNEVYTMIRGSILMMNPLPSMAQAFAILIQDVKQREFKPSNQLFIKSSSLNVSVGPSGASSSGASSSSGGRNFRTNYSAASSSSNNRPRLFCEHCRKPGHTKDMCYKLHGYPQNPSYNAQHRHNNTQGTSPFNNFQQRHQNILGQRFIKGKGITTNAVGDFGANEGAESEKQVQMNQAPNITKEQYDQLINMMQQFHITNTDSTSEVQMNSGAVDFAGPLNEEPSGNW
ncbi:uncharacterized protein LOC132064848 [Lycium ferocissimum]|uniref:uncharacterized protein LOC132064848 n=1 Tax=Lycium ferocissimum TaxID=112874 RepID=UPI0028167854|nr:uncharacterized protein LOC132064848 [Lycium ferocissimum]